MDIDTWFWLAIAFWLGAGAGFTACALMQAGRNSDIRRAGNLRTARPDLLSENVSRF